MLLITREAIEKFIETIDDMDYFKDQIDPDGLVFELTPSENNVYTGADVFPVEYEETSFTANSAKATSISLGGLCWYNVHFKNYAALVEGEIWCSYEVEAQVYSGDGDDGFGLENTGYTKTGDDVVTFNISIHKEGDEMVWELV